MLRELLALDHRRAERESEKPDGPAKTIASAARPYSPGASIRATAMRRPCG